MQGIRGGNKLFGEKKTTAAPFNNAKAPYTKTTGAIQKSDTNFSLELKNTLMRQLQKIKKRKEFLIDVLMVILLLGAFFLLSLIF
jgi:hypothetical protein